MIHAVIFCDHCPDQTKATQAGPVMGNDMTIESRIKDKLRVLRETYGWEIDPRNGAKCPRCNNVKKGKKA